MDHLPTAQVTWDWGSETCAIVVENDLTSGEGIYNNYGPKSNEECELKSV